MLDILIRNGWVADGTGNPVYPADIAIQGDKVVEVTRLPGAQAARVIDATGKIAAPGFIDAHSHSDWSIHANPTGESTIRQGVTTEIVGQCGLSSAPVTDASRGMVTGRLRTYAYDGEVTWSTFAEYLDAIAKMGTSYNLAYFVGHNTVRQAAGVYGPEVAEDQLRTMESFVAEAIEAGAVGVSTGLEFEPGRVASAPEIQRVVNVAGRYGALYGSHIRNRAQFLEEAVDEYLDTAKKAGVRGEISHLNVRENTGAKEGAWHRVVATIDRARQDGLEVLADTTPFLDGLGQMQGILPPWLLNEGTAKAAELLKDPDVRPRVKADCDRYWRFIYRGDWHRVSLHSSHEFPELCGKSFPEIADIMHKDPWDCFFDILAAAGPKMDSLILTATLLNERHSADMVSNPLFGLTVDGFTSRIDGPLAEASRHPICFAGMTHYLTHHVREMKTLTLEEAVRKMTSMPANHHGFHDRGLLRPGFKADVQVFDFAALDDGSTVKYPLVYAKGVEHVLVNGVPVIAGGQHTGARPGRNLLRA